MSQAALSTAPADNSVIAFEAAANEAQTAMNAALFELSKVAFAHSLAKTDSKEALAQVAVAERLAQWAAFDVINTIEDKEEARTTGDSLGAMIAKARKVADKSVAVYRQRGRDLVVYRAEVAKAGETHVIAKGERAGESVNGRDKSSPFAVVQKLRANASKNAEKKAADAPFKAKARELVAKAMNLSDTDLVDALSTPGAESLALAVMIEDQITALRSQSTILDDFRAMLLRLADSDEATQREAWTIAQGFLAPQEA